MNQKTQEQDQKEKQLIQELRDQKVETLSQTGEAKQKYEAEIRELQQKVKD